MDGGRGNEPNNSKIRDTVRDVRKKDGDKFDFMTEGIIAFIQQGDLNIFKNMADDPKLEPKNIFKYAREVDTNILFSTWYTTDQTIKPIGIKDLY